jgi:hypothetical protein
MVKWEYEVVDLAFKSSVNVRAHLNLLGSYGWELVTMVRHIAYLKRQVAVSAQTTKCYFVSAERGRCDREDGHDGGRDEKHHFVGE